MTSDFEYMTYTDSDWPVAPENEDGDYDDDWGGDAGWTEVAGRTEALISQGRATAPRGRHKNRPKGNGWTAERKPRLTRRTLIIAGAASAALAILLAIILPGGGASWPASVPIVKQEIQLACQNPNVSSDPSEVNFACAKDTSQILWVFALLTSGAKPGYTDPTTGRKGLEPITPAQGGEVAWSLDLHHPYNPASPVDSLAVAARAINNIIGGATITSSTGSLVVQPGLESTPANCQRYTGSTALVSRQGFPALCAKPVTSPDGQAALVSDVYRQWMVGAPAQDAADAAILFTNSDNPGNPQVQAILRNLEVAGL